MSSEFGSSTSVEKLSHIQSPRRLAGMLEVGGSMWVKVQNQRGSTFLAPTLSMNENDVNRLERIKDVYGGKIVRNKPHSWQWSITGNPAIEAAREIQPFSPSRQKIIQVFNQLDDPSLPKDQKVELAKNSKHSGRSSDLSSEEYRTLVQNAEFLAGVVDGRGIIGTHEYYIEDEFPHDYVYPSLKIHSGNTALLEALHDEYGGIIDTPHEQGDIVMIRGKEVTLKNTMKVWRSQHTAAKNVFGKIRGLTLARRDELPLLQDD